MRARCGLRGTGASIGGFYRFHHGYWGLHIGFYGGVDYGYGYVGHGYYGGYWNGGHFFYNTTITRVNVNVIRNVYIHPVSDQQRGDHRADQQPGELQRRARRRCCTAAGGGGARAAGAAHSADGVAGAGAA